MYKVAESSGMYRNTPRLLLSVTFPLPLAYAFRLHVFGTYKSMVTFAGDNRLWAVDIGQMWVERNKTESSTVCTVCCVFGTGR